jgi:DNA-binding GntR family transcriptional regulator
MASGMMAEAIEEQTTPARLVRVNAVYEAIEERILTRSLPAGQRINIEALARELQVSPTPVREALGRLAAERYVNFLPYKGYAVVPAATPRQHADMIGVRRLLEVEGARLAVVRATATHLHAIRRELDTITADLAQDAVDPARWRAHSRAIHDLLMRAADSDALYDVWRALKAPFMIARVHFGLAEVNYPAALGEHRAIYEAIRSRDAEAAAAAVHAHIDAAEERIVGAFLLSD